MAETAYCLRRSFSNPSEINSLDYPSQVDATHALGGSISFGRYMSETLDWEKWSAFTQNRYIEEAERYSKPGSVAKMKAYFESHYGRFGAKKKNATQNQKNDTPETAPEDKPDVDVLYDSAEKLKDQKNEVDSCSVEELVNVDVINRPLGVQVTSFKDDEPIASVSESSIKEDKAKDSEKNYIVSTTPKRKVVVKPETEKLDLMSERNLGDYSVKRSKKSNMSKLSSSISRLANPIRCKKEGNDDPKGKVRKISSSLARLATPIRCQKEGNDDPKSKLQKISSSLARLATPVRPRKDGNVTPRTRTSVKESVGSQKQTFQRLQMSINVSSGINVMKKPFMTPCKAGVGKVFTPLGKSKRDTFGSCSTPRVSVNSVSRHPCATPQSAARKSRVALEKSFDLSRRMDHKLKSTSAGNVKSSTPSTATFASFSFRTEERAAKRREFFQKKLEKEAENLQPKNKAKSMNLKADAAAYIRTTVLTDNMKKAKEIPSAQQPPTSEAKFISDLARDKSFLPFQRTAGSKPSSENSKMSKKIHENASPNIL